MSVAFLFDKRDRSDSFFILSSLSSFGMYFPTLASVGSSFFSHKYGRSDSLFQFSHLYRCLACTSPLELP